MNFEEKKLPLIEWTIDEDDMNLGVDAISFVDSPATEVEWQLFNNNIQKFTELNKSKRFVTSPIMLADTPIYRRSETMGEYYGKFSANTIEKMMIKYFKDNKINRVNENHESNKKVDNVYLVESFIVGDRTESKIFKDLPNGTWVGTFYIDSEDYWNTNILSGEFNGFSLEGAFMETAEDEMMSKFYEKVKSLYNQHPDEAELKNNLLELLSKQLKNKNN